MIFRAFFAVTVLLAGLLLPGHDGIEPPLSKFARTPLASYNDLQKDLLSRRISRSTVEAAFSLFPDEHSFQDTISALEKLAARRPDPMELDVACRKAYFAFIKLPASHEVLYQFLAERDAALANSDLTTDPGSALAWGWAYAANAEIDAFMATFDLRYIDMFLRGARQAFAHTDRVLGRKDSFGRDNIDGWSLNEPGKPGREITLPARIITPMIRLALDIRGYKEFDAKRKEEILSFAERGIAILKPYLAEQVIEGDQRYFRNLWSGEHDAINHMAAFAEASMLAFQYGGDPAFRDFAVGFEHYFVAHATPMNTEIGRTALSWPYQVLPKDQYEEQFWKAAITLPALVYLDESGLKLDEGVRVGLLWSVLGLVIRQNRSINTFIGKMDLRVTGGTSERIGYSRGLLFTHLMLLDAWEPTVRDTILDTVAARPDVFPNGLLLHVSDAVAYAHMLRFPARFR
jgi:hypothetical protein